MKRKKLIRAKDFYITLDLTTHVPPSLAHDKKGGSKTNKRGSNKSLANAPGSARSLSQPTQAQEDGASPPTESLPADRMQIVDLHGENPLISFNNTLYSCHWATDVGTSLYLTPPSTDVDDEHPPLRSTSHYDLVGTGFARLIAAPATINPRSASLSPRLLRQKFPGHQTFSTAEGDVIRQTETQGFRIELPSTANPVRVNQARFLERLSAIKARRGDQDAVPISNIKIYRPPQGWEKERDEWISKETALSDRNRLEAEIRAAKNLGRVRFTPVQGHVGSVDRDTLMRLEGGGAEGDYFSDQDMESPEPTLSSQIPRKRKTRGGPRGGAPSSKRLRESLGLPEARREARRPVGRPRKLRLDPDLEEEYQAGFAAAESAGSHQGSVEPSAEHTRENTEDVEEQEL